jgi:hypothetical protein
MSWGLIDLIVLRLDSRFAEIKYGMFSFIEMSEFLK